MFVGTSDLTYTTGRDRDKDISTSNSSDTEAVSRLLNGKIRAVSQSTHQEANKTRVTRAFAHLVLHFTTQDSICNGLGHAIDGIHGL